ncbi:DUF1254 domain-containing protein [Sphingomonas profundi]|uniref:DUF1254 domain-containing protein n=1 Tax=Alterirhizorhabdus profundi TaxID=2681549 RepID=UPI0012E72184|nr:DUF1254 domain-containing protein [Sphingomonas profundi]
MRGLALAAALLGAAAAAQAAPVPPGAPANPFAGEARDMAALAERAYVWGMPLVEAARIRERFISPGGDMPASPLNRFVHRRKLAGPEMKAGVGPNNDTIYSLAWLDLAAGPIILTAPDFGSRYYTFSINLADSSGNQSLGQRTHGGQLPPLFIHGPGYRGAIPAGMVNVPSTTRFVNIAGRILVRGPAEYPLVNALQDRIALHDWQDWQAGRRVPAAPVRGERLDAGPADSNETMQFYHRLGSVLRDWVVQPRDAALVRSFAALGLNRQGFTPGRVPPAALEQGYAAGTSLVAARSLTLGVQQNGWTTNYRGPRFGGDYLLRAAVAKDQIYVTIPEEAIYPIGRVDLQGRPIDGRCRYRIRFAPGAFPPVDAFWSVTAYDNAGHMIPNPAQRYSVGDRTAVMAKGKDGSVTIILSADDPHDPAANWLPIATGPSYLMMRLYRPKPPVLAGRWSPPAIERLEPWR